MKHFELKNHSFRLMKEFMHVRICAQIWTKTLVTINETTNSQNRRSHFFATDQTTTTVSTRLPNEQMSSKSSSVQTFGFEKFKFICSCCVWLTIVLSIKDRPHCINFEKLYTANGRLKIYAVQLMTFKFKFLMIDIL